MKTQLIAILVLLAGFTLQAQEKQQSKKDSKYETVKIQTSAICGDCKERIEHDLAFEKGVKDVELDNETKIVRVTFKKGKNSKEGIKKAITKIGYDADDLPADQEAHDALPKCCQKGNEPH